MDLKDKVRAADAAIESKTREASELKVAWEAKKTAMLESDVDVTKEDSPEFEAAHDAHRAYGEAADEVDRLRNVRESLWAQMSDSGNGNGGSPEARQLREGIKDGLHSRESAGARVVASEAYKELRDRGAFTSSGRLGQVELAQMMDRDELLAQFTGGGRQASVIVTDEAGDDTVRPFIEPEHRGLIEPRFRPLLIRDLITVGTTDSDSIDYIVETGWVNAAAPVPEATTDEPIDGTIVTPALGGRKPQSRLSYEKKDAPVVTIAHWVAATKKSLADVARLRTLIDARLRRGLDDVGEDQIIDGDGTGENLLGILNTPGVQHQAIAGVLVENILKAMTKVELAFFRATATALNPLDWEEIRLMRDLSGGAGTGQYLFGPPSQTGASTLWGRPVVTGPQFPNNQPIVGDWRTAEFLLREGVQVLASDSHEDFFTRNMVAILAEFRAGLIVPQPEAFCEVST